MNNANRAPNPPWFHLFPGLDALRDTAWTAASAQVPQVTLAAESTIFQHGTACQNYLFVLSGSVRVTTLSAEGREVVLYHVGPGSTCTLTTSCLLGETDYPADGVAELEVRAAVMPKALFNHLLAHSDGFRRFVFQQISERMVRLMVRVQELAFERTHVRLIRTLLATADLHLTVHRTHAQLATELGTAREVISRLLKTFEMDGWVRRGRGDIQLTDPAALKKQLER